MDAELAQQIFGLQQYIEQVADRRTLIAAHVGDPRLQQGLGNGQDTFAPEGFPCAQSEMRDFLAE